MKKNKLIIPICLLIILLISVLLLYFFLSKDSSNNNTNVEDNNIEQPPESTNHVRTTVNVAEDIKTFDIDKRIKEILTDSYKYYLLSSGNVNIDKNKTITKNSKKYSLVLLDGINSVDDINKLIDNLFVKSFISIKKEEVMKDKEYITENGKLYLNIKNPLCHVSYNLDDMTYSYRVINNLVYVAFKLDGNQQFEFQIFNDDGKYKVSAPFYDCRFG